MMRTWIKRMGRKWLGAARRPSQARLGVEALESRVVPVLIGGRGPGPQLLTPRYGMVGDTLLYGRPPTQMQPIATHVASMQSDPAGDAVALLERGGLTYFHNGSAVATVDASIQAMTFSNGTLVALDSSGNLDRVTPSTGLQALASNVRSFATTADGTLYRLTTPGTGGSLDKLSPGGQAWAHLDGGVTSFAVAPSGRLYALRADGSLEASDAGQPGSFWTAATAMRSFALLPGTAVLTLSQSGAVWYSPTGLPGTWQQSTGPGFVCLAAVPGASAFALAKGGTLWDSPTGQHNSWRAVESRVQSFSVLGGKIDLVLQAGGYGETLDQAGGIGVSDNGLFAAQDYDPATGRTFNFQQGTVAPDGYSVWDVQQGATGDCVFCAAMASAVGQGLDLGGKITYLDGSRYRVLFYGEPIQTVTFDGRIYAAGISPRIDAYGNLTNAWAMILERAYLQAHGVPWATNTGPQPTGWIFSAWDKPKVAQYDLIGGDKNNWSVYADHDAQAHMAAALRAGNLVTVDCDSGAVEPGLNWHNGHEFAVLGMWTSNGQVMVELYNPHGIPADGSVAVAGRPYYGTRIDGQTYDAEGLFVLPWAVFASHFGTFTTCGSNNV